MATRAQARRAIEWETWYAADAKQRRRLGFPTCVTCGADADGTFKEGEPRYPCGPHEPFRLDDGTLDRARKEFGRAESRPVSVGRPSRRSRRSSDRGVRAPVGERARRGKVAGGVGHDAARAVDAGDTSTDTHTSTVMKGAAGA